MYYIQADVGFQNGINKMVYGFHYISKYNVDYINKIMEVEISSSPSKEEWLEREYFSPYVSFLELDEVPDFNTDPAHFILKKLVTKPGTVFYGLKVEKDYELVSLSYPEGDINE